MNPLVKAALALAAVFIGALLTQRAVDEIADVRKPKAKDPEPEAEPKAPMPDKDRPKPGEKPKAENSEG